MELTELKNEIIASYKASKNELNKIIKLVEEDHSIFPFNEYEHLICTLIAKKGLTYRPIY
jgi:mRNA degradation ribonuclease J1/J2